MITPNITYCNNTQSQLHSYCNINTFIIVTITISVSCMMVSICANVEVKF